MRSTYSSHYIRGLAYKMMAQYKNFLFLLVTIILIDSLVYCKCRRLCVHKKSMRGA